MRPIVNPDTTNESPEYWEEVLKSHGLGEEDHKLLSSDEDNTEVDSGFRVPTSRSLGFGKWYSDDE